MKSIIDLSGKKIIVTGASSGIGRAAAILCSQLGAEVALVARNADRLNETLSMMENGAHRCFAVDLSEPENAEKAVEQIVNTMGKIDGLVHAAGISARSTLRILELSKVKPAMSVNFFAFAQLVACLSLRKNSNDGFSIVGVSSMAVVNGKGNSFYAATKAAMESFSHVSQQELVRRRGRINMVRPTMTRTEMTEFYFSEHTDAELDKIYPLGICQTQDVANCIAFLLSDASSKIIDQTIQIDSGNLFAKNERI